MARARNIKPAFFTNDDLADCQPLARLLFIGLWCVADCEGRLKDKPRQIKVQILPYDDCDTDSLLINLEQSGFIQRYSVQGQPLIQVVNFTTHQNPHKNEKEKGSEFGSYDDRDKTTDTKQLVKEDSRSIQINPDKDGTSRADSLLLIPDSLNPKDQPPLSVAAPPTCKHMEIIDIYHEVLPELAGVIKQRYSGSAKEKNLKARWREDKAHQDLAFWKSYFELVRTNPHWMGGNDRGWKANFEFITKRGNFDTQIEKGTG